MTIPLAQEIDLLVMHDEFRIDLSDDIITNLAPRITLRHYQLEALDRWMFYTGKYKKCRMAPHLLFHMATGSGKTVLMASLILDLYRRGYHKFIFFVNSAQIIKKTKENFLNMSSSKYLFKQQIQIDGRPVNIREVNTFDAVSEDSINIHFTTIQALHTRMHAPKENSITIEDFQNHKIALISDEAHHLNAETKNILNRNESIHKDTWERTVSNIFGQNDRNVLLEFTATLDIGHEKIRAKYEDKILFDYSLRQFRKDGYSKEIELRQADLPPKERMIQAVILSQYRRKIAEAHGIHCKPIILMKSKTIEESIDNERAFVDAIKCLSDKIVYRYRDKAYRDGDEVISLALDYVLSERRMEVGDFILEIQEDFATEKVVNVNKVEDLEQRQVQLNSLEDRENEIRVIFAVNKLNEGWDVLNLFDIVRLYDTHGDKGKIASTTPAEAQLIGRGARYFPFIDKKIPELPEDKRKYDDDRESPLCILEDLYYHCSHNPQYIREIRSALRESGMLDLSDSKDRELRLKENFKMTSLYKKGVIWYNERIENSRHGVGGLNFYRVGNSITNYEVSTGRIIEDSAFSDENTPPKPETKDPVSKDFNLLDFGVPTLNFAMDSIRFFHFNNLRVYFPNISSTLQFIVDESYLGGIKIPVRGVRRDLNNLSAIEKVKISIHSLHEIQQNIIRENSDYIGTKDFKFDLIRNCFKDRILKLPSEGERGRSWEESKIPEISMINLNSKDWFAYEDNYGTDQEKHFIKFMNDQAEYLRNIYEEFYLVQNVKAVKIYDFETGRGFEPDFILFLRKNSQNTVVQLFIEVKGDHLLEHDKWKQDFLSRIKAESRIETLIQGKDYTILGLPLFGEDEKVFMDFKKAFEQYVIN